MGTIFKLCTCSNVMTERSLALGINHAVPRYVILPKYDKE